MDAPGSDRLMEEAEVPSRTRRWGFSKLGQILVVGLVIREALSFWTGHPYDFEVWL
jgi:hypothetical protein